MSRVLRVRSLRACTGSPAADHRMTQCPGMADQLCRGFGVAVLGKPGKSDAAAAAAADDDDDVKLH